MTPRAKRESKGRTRVLDRTFDGVGRIARASGTTDAALFRKINRTLTRLHDDGRIDVLESVRDGRIAPLEAHHLVINHRLDRIPDAAAAHYLCAAWRRWMTEKECSEAHRRSLAQSLRHLRAREQSAINDLPGLLERAKKRLRGKAQSFRLCRMACLAFAKEELKRSHPIYIALTDVAPLRVRPKRGKHPMTRERLAEVYRELEEPARGMMLSMALTGMRVNEYYGEWATNRLSRAVAILGTKTDSARRVAPLVIVPVRPSLTYKPFRAALAKVGLTPYDCRRTYANLMEAAGIPRTRRRLYLGHSAGDVTDGYEWHEVLEFLSEDAEKLSIYLQQLITTHTEAL